MHTCIPIAMPCQKQHSMMPTVTRNILRVVHRAWDIIITVGLTGGFCGREDVQKAESDGDSELSRVGEQRSFVMYE